MNNRSSNLNEPDVSPEALDQGLREDLAALHRLPVPAMSFDPLSVRTPARGSALRRRWRPAFAAAAAVAGVALIAGGTSLFGGPPSEVSAQELFERTHALAAMQSTVSSDVSYHMVARNESLGPPGMGSATVNTTTETWYQDPQHQRYETFDENGELIFGNSHNGDDVWFYSTVPGEDGVRVVQSAVSKTGFMAFRAADFGAKDLASLLEMYSGSCAKAEKVGEETIAGRETYVIEVTQTPETCDIKPVITTEGNLTTVKGEAIEGAGFGTGVAAGSVHVMSVGTEPGEGTPAGDAQAPEVEFRIVETTTRMWVDQETFITLKTETESEEGLLFRYEVTEFEVNPDFDPSVFAYEPPAGAEVIEAAGPGDIKLFLSGGVAGTFSGGSFEVAPSLDVVEAGETER